jgi:hypothetical protein
MKIQTLMVVPTSAIFLAIALFIGAVINAHAGHHGYMMFSSDIRDMDTNNDGVVSFEEYSALHSEMLRWGFNAIDSDNDGSISANEWETFLKMHGVVKGHNKNRQS